MQTDTSCSDGEVILSRLGEEKDKEKAEILAYIALNMLCDIQSIHVPLLEGKLLPWKAAIHSGNYTLFLFPVLNAWKPQFVEASRVLPHRKPCTEAPWVLLCTESRYTEASYPFLEGLTQLQSQLKSTYIVEVEM